MHLTRALFSVVKKTTTGIYGIPVHPNPRPHLIETYRKTLTALERLPPSAVYRQATTSITQQRLAIVEANEDIQDIEEKLDAGQIEEAIMQAEDELSLVGKMEEWKAWEPLEVEPPARQWEYPGRKVDDKHTS
ncbi:uncharacterized protein VTP21DRAFT_1957 [Calcarisporiella thermophila]|uniref:uncharacterized protein n=1 Tax=Calcarisporiella thermophila TaxID=911321 RepID=UPI0037437AF8